MMKKAYILVLMLVTFFNVNSTRAGGIPVYDASSFTQMLTQIDAMTKDYESQLSQLDEAVKQSKALTGTRNAGDLSNGILEKQLREYLPNTWQETMSLMNTQGLSQGAKGTQGIYSDLMNTYDPLTGSDAFSNNPDSDLSKAFDRRTNTTYASMAASEQAYNNVNSRIKIYESLLSELNESEDLKSSVDLQARISAENGLILSEIMRLNAIQMQQRSSIENEKLINRKRSSIANSFDSSVSSQSIIIGNSEN